MGNWNRSYYKRRRYNKRRWPDRRTREVLDGYFSRNYTASTIRWMSRLFFTRIIIFTLVSGFSLALLKCYLHYESLYVSF